MRMRTEKNMNKKPIYITLAVVLVLALIILNLSIFTSLSILEAGRIVLGSILVLFIPGFIISFIFFETNKIDWIERIALSFALSIAIVPLVIFYLNLSGIKINTINSFLTILGIILISIVIIRIKKKWKK